MTGSPVPPLSHGRGSLLGGPRICRSCDHGETVNEPMARVLAQKTGVERLAIAAGMFRSARRMIERHLRTEHPNWDVEQVRAETARRLADGAG